MKLDKLFALIVLSLVPTLWLTACSNNYIDKTDNKLYFKGESENWRGAIIEEFTEIWREDEKGKLAHDNSVKETLVLKYKGSEHKNIGITGYEYYSAAGSGSGSISLDPYGYAILNLGGGENVAINREDQTYTLTVEWNNDKKESLELKAMNRSVPPAKLKRYIREMQNH